MFFSSFFLLLLAFGHVTGADIKMEGTTAVNELIDQLDLKCLLKNFNEDQIVYQLYIKKGNDILARVDTEQKIDILRNDLDVLASGSIDTISHRGFLNLTIRNPWRGLTGKYSCEALGWNEDGSEIEFKSQLFTVDVHVPSDYEMNDYLLDQIVRFEALFTELDVLESNLVENGEIVNVQNRLHTFIRDFNDRLSTVENHRKIEVGSATCDYTHNSGNEWVFSNTNIRFKTAFSRKPTVLTSFRSGEMTNHFRISLMIPSVSNQGFESSCGTRLGTKMSGVVYDWIAIE